MNTFTLTIIILLLGLSAALAALSWFIWEALQRENEKAHHWYRMYWKLHHQIEPLPDEGEK